MEDIVTAKGVDWRFVSLTQLTFCGTMLLLRVGLYACNFAEDAKVLDFFGFSRLLWDRGHFS